MGLANSGPSLGSAMFVICTCNGALVMNYMPQKKRKLGIMALFIELLGSLVLSLERPDLDLVLCWTNQG